MTYPAVQQWQLAVAVSGMLSWTACDDVLELQRFEIGRDARRDAEVEPICTTDSECADDASSARRICSVMAQRCVPLLDERCGSWFGDDSAAALRLGAVFSLHGAQAATNIERVHSVQLAVEEINAAGGVPTDLGPRPLQLIACDAADPLAAGHHLTDDLGVAAIIGPNSSQDALDLATHLTIQRHTLTVSPTAMADSIADLADDDLSWLMVPTDAQRTPLVLDQLRELTSELGAERPLSLSVIYRDDVFGVGMRQALTALQWNDKNFADPQNLAHSVRVDTYDPLQSDQRMLVTSTLSFQPDVIVLAGMAEGVTSVLGPLEAQLHVAGVQRLPRYLLSDATKTPELLELVAVYPDLGPRVRGIGVLPSGDSSPVFADFQRAFRERFPADVPDISGLGPAYDAVYAVALAAAAEGGKPSPAGLGMLAGGTTRVRSGAADLSSAFAALRLGGGVTALGTHGPLAWDERGVPRATTLQVWCIDATRDPPAYGESGLSFDVSSQERRGAPGGCVTRTATAQGPVTQGDRPRASDTLPPSTPDLPAEASAPRDDGSDAGVPEPSLPVLKALYHSNDASPYDSTVTPSLRLTNEGTGPGVPLASLTMRYYFSNENTVVCPDGCRVEVYWSGFLPTGVELKARARYVPTNWISGYLEVTYDPGTPLLGPGQSAEAQLQFHTNSYQDFDETNDYSYDSTHAGFAESERVTVYRDLKLVWGVPPLF